MRGVPGRGGASLPARGRRQRFTSLFIQFHRLPLSVSARVLGWGTVGESSLFTEKGSSLVRRDRGYSSGVASWQARTRVGTPILKRRGGPRFQGASPMGRSIVSGGGLCE